MRLVLHAIRDMEGGNSKPNCAASEFLSSTKWRRCKTRSKMAAVKNELFLTQVVC